MDSGIYYTTEIGRMRAAEARNRAEAFRTARRARGSTDVARQPQAFYRRALAIATFVWKSR